ncbi:HET domain-containing protein [Trichoderma gracile]
MTMSAQAGQKRQRSDSDGEPKPKRLPRNPQNGIREGCCKVCTLMLSHQGLQHLNSPNGFLHQNRTGCVASADHGCGFCKLVLFAVCKEHDGDWNHGGRLLFRNSLASKSPETNSTGIYNLQVAFESNPGTSICTMQLFAKKGDPMATIVRRRPLHRDVKSNKVFAAAKALIKECMNTEIPHRHCQYSRDTVLPLRVLDVGKPGDAAPKVKLKINETDTHAPYLALSYCWGPQAVPEPLRLRRDNVEALVEGIELQDLQQSIQDAIFATRKLGYQYLWIDALCIIQDCSIDKGAEIGRMASIYKNASITIAAATSSDAAHGFLTGKPEARVSLGWTLQEFMLSSRMLIFSDYELLWQCKEVDLLSVSPKGLDYLQPLETLPWTVFDSDAEPYYGTLDSEKLYLWKTIVQQYTDRELSYTGDKLNAIKGITSELETLWRDTNVYGLWKKWFIELLAWYKPLMERDEQRHLERAPSWSWASLDGAIVYEGSFSAEDARLKSLTVQAVELSCRILRESDVSEEKASTIIEQPDLKDPLAELQLMGINAEKVEYVLIGTVQLDKDSEEGVGLLVIDIGSGVYQRLGSVRFQDMTIWESVQRRDITLDARVNKKTANKEVVSQRNPKISKKRERNKR